MLFSNDTNFFTNSLKVSDQSFLYKLLKKDKDEFNSKNQ